MEQHRPPVSTAGYWDGLYAGGNDGWELGAPAPALEHWLDTGGRFETATTSVRGPRECGPVLGSPSASGGPQTELGECGGHVGAPALERGAGPSVRPQPHIAVPGCGRGHDARLLARHGYRVSAFDFAEAAVAEAQRLAQGEGVDVTVEQRDVFTLGRDYPGAFDGVWEYTCFCAIDPGRREEYASVLHAILRPGGLLLACFYPLREGEDGPPFPVSHADIDRVLTGRFTVLEAGPPARSVERRRGLEWLVLARRMPA